MGRYDGSSDEGGAGGSKKARSRSPRRSSRYSESTRTHRDYGGSHRSHSRRSHDRSSSSSSHAYKVLCISSIHHKVNEDIIRDDLYREFRKYPDVSIKVVYEHDGERVAYVYFRNSEDARSAKHASKNRIVFYDKPALIEAVYDTAPPEYVVRRRSRSPMNMMDFPPMDMRYIRHRTPPLPPLPPHEFERYGPPIPGPLDPFGYDLPPPPDPYAFSRGFPYREPPRGPPFPPFVPPYGHQYNRPRFERQDRKERFPNYLHHIAPEDDPTSCRTLFAGNMELNITDEEIRRIFSRYGSVEDVDIKRPPPGTGNAFAFVRFENLDQSYKCKLELSGQYIGKFQVKIGYGKPLPSCKVWVGNLGTWTTVAMLEREFDRFGAIKKIDYVKGDHSAHVLFETLDAAQAAVNEMRGFPLGGPDKRLRTDFAPDETSVQFIRRSDNGRGSNKSRSGGNRGGGGDRDSGDIQYHHSVLRGGAGSADTSNGQERSPSPSTAHPDPVAVDNGASEEQSVDDGVVKSLNDVAKAVGSAWHGALILKSSLFACKFHRVSGADDIGDSLLSDDSSQPLLRITQRLRLDQPKLDDVQKRITSSVHAIFLALPTISVAVQPPDSSVQARSLRNLVSYLKQKEAAGVISLVGEKQENGAASAPAGVLYAFPPCAFSRELLSNSYNSLSEDCFNEDHLMVVVVKGSTV